MFEFTNKKFNMKIINYIKILVLGFSLTLCNCKYKTNTQPYYRMLGPNGEDLSNGSADYEHHGNRDDFKAWLEKGLKLYNEAK